MKQKQKVGNKIFSRSYGLLEIEAIRGTGKNRECKITILDKEYWILESHIQ